MAAIAHGQRNRARGVAAIDAAGHESFVTAYVTPPRVSTDIKTKPGT